MFFKRRSRSNSSYVDDSSPRERSQSYDPQYHNDKYERPDSSRHNAQDFESSEDPEKEMYARQHGPQESYNAARGPHPSMNGGGHTAPLPIHNAAPAPLNPSAALKAEPAPDLLTRAFNEAIRPHMDKIDQLEAQVQEMQSWIDELEEQRKEMHDWIDKRGLRPDVPLSIARSMDNPASPASAVALSTQLDRKITIVNFDLHRLQDDLNSSLSTSHFAAAMLKFLPDIERLSALPSGPRLAFDLLLKLGGNLNAHGGLDSGDPEDTRARQDFYARLDNAMVNVVQGRFNEKEEWAVSKEIKRIEKTAQYLKAFGIEPYFPETLNVMRREETFNSSTGARASTGHLGPQSPITNGATPPRYH